jgi:hypothetical protein
MKALALAIMFVALCLLYRIAYPKQTEIKKGDDVPEKKEIDSCDVMGKSLFTRTDISTATPTPATSLQSVKQVEKAVTFASGNRETDVAVPSERLDEIFGEEPNPEDLDIPPDDDENAPDAEEESEELRLSPERGTELANGFSIEEMENAAKAIDSPADENAEILYRVDKTDMFEKLVSGDEGKRQMIAAVIDRHIRSLNPEVASEENDGDYVNFNMADYLS